MHTKGTRSKSVIYLVAHIHQSMGLINEGDVRAEGDNRSIRREGNRRNWRDWGAMRSESGLREAASFVA